MTQDLHRHDWLDASYGHARLNAGSGALGLAVLLTLGFAAAEWIAARYAGSVALMADAGHMLTDASSLMLALLVQRLARRAPQYDRIHKNLSLMALVLLIVERARPA